MRGLAFAGFVALLVVVAFVGVRVLNEPLPRPSAPVVVADATRASATSDANAVSSLLCELKEALRVTEARRAAAAAEEEKEKEEEKDVFPAARGVWHANTSWAEPLPLNMTGWDEQPRRQRWRAAMDATRPLCAQLEEMRASRPAADEWMKSEIPPMLWRTYEDGHMVDNPEAAAGVFDTWIRDTHMCCDRLPSERAASDADVDRHLIMNAKDRAAFMERYFARDFPEILEAYHGLQNVSGVMGKDVFSFAVMYIHGGASADTDMSLGDLMSDKWLNQREPYVQHADALPRTFEPRSCGVLLSIEPDTPWFQIWFVASVRRHPVLLRYLHLVAKRYREGIKTFPNMVHYHTGPAAWTEAVASFLGGWDGDEPPPLHARHIYNRYNSDPAYFLRASSLRLCIFGHTYLLHEVVRHHYGSTQWAGEGTEYVSWRRNWLDTLFKDRGQHY